MSEDIHTCSYYCERPACIKAQRNELREQNAALRAGHPSRHVPSVKRIQQAHSTMTRGNFLNILSYEEEHAGHRIYNQSADEQCYLCALYVLLQESEKENEALRSAETKIKAAITKIEATEFFHDGLSGDLIDLDKGACYVAGWTEAVESIKRAMK